MLLPEGSNTVLDFQVPRCGGALSCSQAIVYQNLVCPAGEATALKAINYWLKRWLPWDLTSAAWQRIMSSEALTKRCAGY